MVNGKHNMTGDALRLVAVIAVTALAAGCRTVPLNTITQVSTMQVLKNGSLHGVVSCEELRRHGDLGYAIGANLDGQYILLDGTLHHVNANGRLGRPRQGARLAFSIASRFQWDQAVMIRERTDRKGAEALVTEATGGMHEPCALKLRGQFLEVRLLTLKAVTADSGVRYEEAVSRRPLIAHKDIGGTVLGYRIPKDHAFFSAPGYRLFFVSDNLEFGGEVVDFTLQQGVAEIDTCEQLKGVVGRKQKAIH